MGTALTITRTDYLAADLRTLAGRCHDDAQVRRLLALALVLEGHPRTQAAKQNGVDRQTLRDWVHRYNALGVDGLKSRRGPGPATALSEQQMAELKALVIRGPDPATDKVVRWRCLDLRQEVARRFNVTVHESTIGKWLHQLGLTRLQPRPFHLKKNAAAQEAFKNRMARPVRKRFLQSDLSSLRQRIRPVSIAPAKMEIRTSGPHKLHGV